MPTHYWNTSQTVEKIPSTTQNKFINCHFLNQSVKHWRFSKTLPSWSHLWSYLGNTHVACAVGRMPCRVGGFSSTKQGLNLRAVLLRVCLGFQSSWGRTKRELQEQPKLSHEPKWLQEEFRFRKHQCKPKWSFRASGWLWSALLTHMKFERRLGNSFITLEK